jgi:hypothetical protein
MFDVGGYIPSRPVAPIDSVYKIQVIKYRMIKTTKALRGGRYIAVPDKRHQSFVRSAMYIAVQEKGIGAPGERYVYRRLSIRQNLPA